MKTLLCYIHHDNQQKSDYFSRDKHLRKPAILSFEIRVPAFCEQTGRTLKHISVDKSQIYKDPSSVSLYHPHLCPQWCLSELSFPINYFNVQQICISMRKYILYTYILDWVFYVWELFTADQEFVLNISAEVFLCDMCLWQLKHYFSFYFKCKLIKVKERWWFF